MRSGRRVMKKISYVILLLAVFLCLCTGSGQVWAAELVDTTHPCSLTLEIPKAYQNELMKEKISVKLYRVADITSDGAYRDIAGYEKLHFSDLSFDVTAEQLEEKAREASAYLGLDAGNTQSSAVSGLEFEIVNNQGCQTDLEPGLYLVCVEPLSVGDNSYQALPYLISLPNLSKSIDIRRSSQLNITYDLVVDLKLAKTLILGANGQQGLQQGESEVKPTGQQGLQQSNQSEAQQSNQSEEQSSDALEVQRTGNPEEEASGEPAVHKTGDEVNLAALFGCVGFFGVAFGILCFVEKRSRKDEDEFT